MSWPLTRLRVALGRMRRELRLDALRRRLERANPGDVFEFPGGISLRITDGANAYMQYKDEIVRRNYAFTTTRADPLVIDGGANMGMFSIATRRDHPGARIIAFEPDPALLGLLRENLDRNGVRNVTLVGAALGAVDGEMAFAADGRAAGALADAGARAAGAPSATGGTTRVRVVRLSAHLGEEVDFLKLNIEGAELEVLREAADAGRLRNVRAMVFEYHGWPGGEQRLGPILSLLDAQGFRYLVHDLDDQTNPVTKPPFREPAGAPWFALVSAWRVGAAGPR